MLRMIGAALVVVSSTGIGFRIARDFRRRPQQLRLLSQAIRLLESEIEYTVTPLPQALERVGNRTDSPISMLFLEAARRLKAGDVSVESAFSDAIDSVRFELALKQADLEVLRDFGQTLGTSDRTTQVQQIQVLLTQLDRLLADARESQQKNERLWQYLGVISGLMIVILLA